MFDNPSNTRAKLRVLVVDDSLVQQKQTVGLLKSLNCEVSTADDGQQALAAIGENDFDLILMDVEMPRMDGLEATSEIRRRERETGSHVLIAATTTLSDRDRCITAGMDAFMQKPLRPELLLTTIEQLLAGREGQAGKVNKSILLAEDDPQVSLPLSVALEASGYDVIAASDGEEALELTRNRHPDLIILDVMMPKRNGISVLGELKEARFERPIIMITGTVEASYRDTAIELGANDFIHKPFPLERVVESVKRLLAA